MTRARYVAATLALAWLAPVACPGRAAEPAEELTKEQRKQLEADAAKLDKEVERSNGDGDFSRALGFAGQALRVREQLYPRDKYPQGHPDLATSLDTLAGLHEARGDYGKALPLAERALAMSEGLYPKDRYPQGHPLLALTVHSLGQLHQDRGDYGRALPLYERALAMSEVLYPKDRYPQGHPHLALSVNNLARLHQARGDYDRALPLYERALAMYDQLASILAGSAAEAEVLNFLATLPLTRDTFLSLPGERLKAEGRLRTRLAGQVGARSLKHRHHDALASRDPATRDLLAQLQDKRRELARRLLTPADPGKILTPTLAALTSDKERLERQLASKVPASAVAPATDPAELVRRLPSGSAFVDLLTYTRFDQDPAKPGKIGEKRTLSYMAFVLAPGTGTRRVELGPADPIDAAVLAWRRALLNGSESPAAGTLRRLVWEPVARLLPADTRAVYVAPDGALARLPWAAFPGSEPGTVLLEEYTLAVVPHGPALLDALTPHGRRSRASDTLLTVGSVAYDRASPSLVARTDMRGVEPPRSAERGAGARWGDLPATGPEAEYVAAVAAPREVLALSGENASVSRLTVELPKARWAHLATHGFFADPSFRSPFQLDERMYDRTTRDRATPGARSPLVLSGLILAGANKPDPAGRGDGGILTAEAIVGLDLSGMDLAVLSACETGLGEVAGGEGVYGLQRAFHIAGCRDVVASLWKVNDEATAALMAVFYRKLWKENLPPLEALRQAQLTIYRHPERIKDLAERGWDTNKTVKLPDVAAAPKADLSKGKAPAKLWAAFVLSGPGQDTHLREINELGGCDAWPGFCVGRR